MLISVKMFTKYVMIIYALDLVHEKFGIKVESKSNQSRSKGEIPGWARQKEWLSRSQLKSSIPN